MKILDINDIQFPDVKIIKFGFFTDHRGYFTEPFRKNEFIQNVDVGSIAGKEILQINESVSKPDVMRGLHFQWSPYMGKLLRTLKGHMVDMFLDIRLNSPTYGYIGMYDMPCHDSEEFSEWIWVPPGFAHGNYFLETTKIEYLCTGEYSPDCEAAISPLSNDLDWSLCDKECKKRFDFIVQNSLIISDKDKNGLTLSDWSNDDRSMNFVYGNC